MSGSPQFPVPPRPLIWKSPSRNSSGSMPIGNGSIGLNVWVEQNGDLLFYLSSTDAWDEHGRLLKTGRVRITLSEEGFANSDQFRQELDLADGCIQITSIRNADTLTARLWVDADSPVVRIEIESGTPRDAAVSLECWRNSARALSRSESQNLAGLRSANEIETITPDIILPADGRSVRWCHRNEHSCWASTMDHQQMTAWGKNGTDPLINRTFGALLQGDGLVSEGACKLRTDEPRRQFYLKVHPYTAQTPTLEEWTDALQDQVEQSNRISQKQAWPAHKAWWNEFWKRSWIHITGTPEAEIVTRGYTLQRYLNACGGRGTYPIKFNGSIFTVDSREEGEINDPDYRRWGGGYWFQNTRLTYWTMIMSGDFDLMEPWFRLYMDALPLATARACDCFRIEQAAVYPETMTFWGSFLNSNYGYERKDLPPGISQNTYIRRYWQGMLELLAVLLDLYAVTEDTELLKNKLLTLAPPFLRFYRDIYKQRDEHGKMRMVPSQSLETWHEAVNPSPDIAGLQWVLDGLLALPDNLLAADLRREWQDLRSILPPLPILSEGGPEHQRILPALSYDQLANSENPELYAIFPYRLFGIGKPDLQTAQATWKARRFKGTGGWRQDAIQATLLGNVTEAKEAVVTNFMNWHSGSRFPAFWGPNFDWIPDQDHGSAAAIALQRMLMQWDQGKIRLLPAWPDSWEVRFRLHAPGQTIVEGHAKEGRMQTLHVSPAQRLADVEPEFVPPGKPELTDSPAPLRPPTHTPLPELLRFNDGTLLQSTNDWPHRRQEIADAILDLEYGGLPPIPESFRMELLHTVKVDALPGVQFSSYRIHTGPRQNFPFTLTLLIPPGEGPFPVILNGDGCWRNVTDEVSATVTSRGFILAQFNRVELAPDIYNSDRTGGIYPLYPDHHFGALSAWAWGYHRCIDALLTLPFVDAGRLAVAGHSRGGKTCLLAGATDSRIALTAPNNSGAGGAGCFRIQGEGSERLADLMRMIPYWHGPDFKKFIGRENELPFDQHFLKAMVAPRALLSTEALDDAWANPYGSWHTHKAARKVYKWLGVADQIGITFRSGEHAHSTTDWQTLLNFMEWRLCGKPVSGSFNRDPFAEQKFI